MFGYKIELNLVQFIMAILDYVSADILKVRSLLLYELVTYVQNKYVYVCFVHRGIAARRILKKS